MASVSTDEHVQYRIGSISAFFIVSTATVMYGMGFLLALTGIGEIATELLDIGLSILFFFWFALLGVNYFSGKSAAKLGIMGACTLVEAIPFINAIVPALIIETVSIILITRREDREKAEENQKKRGAAISQRNQNMQRANQYVATVRQRQQVAANDAAQEQMAA